MNHAGEEAAYPYGIIMNKPMEIRSAEPSDYSRVATLAHDSLRASYSLSPDEIETLLQHEFDADTLAERLNDPRAQVLIAEDAAGDKKDIQGFVEVVTGEERTIRWLHVDPQARGNGIGTALLERVRETDSEKPLAAHILEDAVEGGEFLKRFDLEKAGNDHLHVDGNEFAIAVFAEGQGTYDVNEPTVAVPDSVSVDGVDRFVARDDRIPGREAPFFATYSNENHSDLYGYFCSNCGSSDVAADGLDRVECGECGNIHLADQWDDSYL